MFWVPIEVQLCEQNISGHTTSNTETYSSVFTYNKMRPSTGKKLMAWFEWELYLLQLACSLQYWQWHTSLSAAERQN